MVPGKSIDDQPIPQEGHPIPHSAILDFEKTYPELAEEFRKIQAEQIGRAHV
jgi:hypothetical protein